MKGFCIMYTYDVALSDLSGEWDNFYTANRNQHSDDGSLIMITGIRDSAVKAFDTSQEMFDYCYASGWTKSEEL